MLALIWVYKVEKRAGAVSISLAEIWFRFPKFVLGYFVAWLSISRSPPRGRSQGRALAGATGVVGSDAHDAVHADVRRDGCSHRLREARARKFAVLYAIALVVVIAPLAYGVAYLFHRGRCRRLRSEAARAVNLWRGAVRRKS